MQCASSKKASKTAASALFISTGSYLFRSTSATPALQAKPAHGRAPGRGSRWGRPAATAAAPSPAAIRHGRSRYGGARRSACARIHGPRPARRHPPGGGGNTGRCCRPPRWNGRTARQGHRRTVVQDGAALGVGRGHQQRAAHAGCGLRAHGGGGNAAQAVRHDDHGMGRSQHGLFKRAHPGQPRGRDPVVLHHAAGMGQALGPQALPVAEAGITPARNDGDGSGAHSAGILRPTL